MLVVLGLFPTAVLAQTAEAAPATEPAPAAEAAAGNDGTDPTRPINSLRASYEHFELRGGRWAGTLATSIEQPFGDGYWTLRARVPFAATNALGNSALGLSDASLRLTRVFGVSRKGGRVAQLEVIAPTAGRDEWGGGKWQLKPVFIQAYFLKNGTIVAPALQHQFSFAGSSRRADVNTTTFDLYVVPRLANRKLFMTIDPALIYDWERKQTFGALAVTLGTNVGRLFGGQMQISVKPSVAVGGDRPFNYGLQAGVAVLGF
ncbi:hypothetical protein [Sandarakinorhabdus sp.]|uniref:hypothetical protein n=1 Tax=Sandarakinorhabdus sp. TaxID=1916663 RepID=UPI00286E1484|nr:hypothetical protein [Sandarakinorhabdus sp.]